jgi:hypothetical protein
MHPYLLKTPVRTSIRTGEIFTNEILNVHPRPSAEFTVPLVTGSAAAAAAVFLVVFLVGLGGIVSDSCCTGRRETKPTPFRYLWTARLRKIRHDNFTHYNRHGQHLSVCTFYGRGVGAETLGAKHSVGNI